MAGILEIKYLKISLSNHFFAVSSLLIFMVILWGILFLFNYDNGILTIFVIGFLLQTIPVLYLHLTYWLKNKNAKYKINENEIIIEKRNGGIVSLKNSDIGKIVIYKSASMDKGGIPILAIESYFYAKIILKSKEEFILTRLLAPKIDEVLRQMKGVSFERKKCLFCMIYKVPCIPCSS